MSKVGLPDLQYTGQNARKLPFFALLLSLILLGSSTLLYFRVMPMWLFGDQILSAKNFHVTPRQMMYNPFGPNYTFERAWEILNCSNHGGMKPSLTLSTPSDDTPLPNECPAYFQMIHRDLAHWKQTGITRTHIQKGYEHAGFKAVILNGRLFIEQHEICFGNRAMFTVWGILLLLEKYKGLVPDVEFLFNCEDRPRIVRPEEDKNARFPLFGYCSTSGHYDIPFPDWSFWGWSDLMIQSWDLEREKIVRGSKRIEWDNKISKAYWSGNPYVGAPHRVELLRCNDPDKSELHIQNWGHELAAGKEHSKLEDQCNYKYMIYTEGVGWSVSLKYIMACGSTTLTISPAFYDFFSRGMYPGVHFIPVRPSQLLAPELCDNIYKQVELGETNKSMAFEIGKAGQQFMREELAMENVYGYAFHLLKEYSKLQKFRPSLPEDPHLVTLDHLLCLAIPMERVSLQEAMKAMPLGGTPCHLSRTPGEGFRESDWEVTPPM